MRTKKAEKKDSVSVKAGGIKDENKLTLQQSIIDAQNNGANNIESIKGDNSITTIVEDNQEKEKAKKI